MRIRLRCGDTFFDQRRAEALLKRCQCCKARQRHTACGRHAIRGLDKLNTNGAGKSPQVSGVGLYHPPRVGRTTDRDAEASIHIAHRTPSRRPVDGVDIDAEITHRSTHRAMKLFIVSLLLGAAAAFAPVAAPKAAPLTVREMHVVSSIGSWKKRSKTCQVIRRRGRYYVIDKKNPRNKARQGGAKMKPWKKGK